MSWKVLSPIRPLHVSASTLQCRCTDVQANWTNPLPKHCISIVAQWHTPKHDYPGILGNRIVGLHAGAVAARLRVYDSGICFVCAHLASGENEGDELKRNYDYSEIVRRGQFPPDSASLDPDASFSGASGHTSQVCSIWHACHLCMLFLPQNWTHDHSCHPSEPPS